MFIQSYYFSVNKVQNAILNSKLLFTVVNLIRHNKINEITNNALIRTTEIVHFFRFTKPIKFYVFSHVTS